MDVLLKARLILVAQMGHVELLVQLNDVRKLREAAELRLAMDRMAGVSGLDERNAEEEMLVMGLDAVHVDKDELELVLDELTRLEVAEDALLKLVNLRIAQLSKVEE
jgi:hypothetical protein